MAHGETLCVALRDCELELVEEAADEPERDTDTLADTEAYVGVCAALGDAPARMEGERDEEVETEPEEDATPLLAVTGALPVIDAELHAVKVVEREAVPQAVKENSEGDALPERVTEGEPEVEGQPEVVTEAEEEAQLEGATEKVNPAERVDVLLIVYVCVEVPLNDGVTLPQPEGETVLKAVDEAHTEGLAVWEGVTLGEPEELMHAERDADAEGLRVVAVLGVVPEEAVAPAFEGELLVLIEKLELLVKVAEAVPAAEAVGAPTLRDTLADTEGVGLEDTVAQPVGEVLGVTEMLGLVETVADAEAHTEDDRVPLDDVEAVGVKVPFAVAAGEAEEEAVAQALHEAPEVAVATLLAEEEPETEGVLVVVPVALVLAVPLAVAEDDGVPSPDGEELSEPVLVSVAQPDAVGEWVADESRLLEGEPEALPL